MDIDNTKKLDLLETSQGWADYLNEKNRILWYLGRWSFLIFVLKF